MQRITSLFITYLKLQAQTSKFTEDLGTDPKHERMETNTCVCMCLCMYACVNIWIILY